MRKSFNGEMFGTDTNVPLHYFPQRSFTVPGGEPLGCDELNSVQKYQVDRSSSEIELYLGTLPKDQRAEWECTLGRQILAAGQIKDDLPYVWRPVKSASKREPVVWALSNNSCLSTDSNDRVR